MKSYVGIVGTDGLDPVVWGMGENENDAWEDANVWLDSYVGVYVTHHEDLRVVPLTEDQYNTVLTGDVSWSG